MDSFLGPLINLLPCAEWLEKIGIGNKIALALAAAIQILAVCLVVKACNALINRYKNCKASRRQLDPWFDYQKVKASRALFIPTKFQNQSPTREEEPSFSHKFVSKSKLIPFFIKTAFNEKRESDKFYLVLADSGMGKTTFMINLYIRYTSFLNFNKKYKIRLFPFGDSRILDMVRAIDRKEALDTILLLDAFDEDKHLLPPQEPEGLTDDDRFHRRLDEIVEAVRDFREVIITSRTQYFPGQEEQPYELKIPRFDEKGFHRLAKFYLSPFDNKEIQCYLNRKYGILRFWNSQKKKNAVSIIKNAPKLMVRPMLLGNIDYLADSSRAFENTSQIYEALIAKWIEREATKRKNTLEVREKFKLDLYRYSHLVAVAIYRQGKQGDMLFLKKEAAIQVARENGINLQDYEITGQSLLTRDAAQNWKFAHKSILEYFIAKEAVEKLSFFSEVNFTGMDMARQFYIESNPEWVFIKGGNFLMGSSKDEFEREDNECQHEVKVGDFFIAKYPVTVKQFEEFIHESEYVTDAEKGDGSYLWTGKEWKLKKGVHWRCDVYGEEQKDKQHPVIHVSWNDAIAYCTWLSKKFNASFRLPTEAEWEYACRAGTITPFNTGMNLTTEQANYNGNYPYGKNPKGKYIEKTTVVGKYPPNAWGLYDMHGNVWEWCNDWFDEKYYDQCRETGIVENPKGPETGSNRVLRGGSWRIYARHCRSAFRHGYNPDYRDYFVGFRAVFVP
jgi:formylglycine-generating enzyme